jgi:hypothetical protein
MIMDDICLKMVEYFKNDAKRICHAIKVWSFARIIGREEGLGFKEQEIVEISAILHDIGIKVCEEKYNSTAGRYQELEGPRAALKILKGFNIEKETLDRVLYLIGNHHSYHKVNGVDFQILIEADFIVNIHEDSIPPKSVEEIKRNHFKTKTGIHLLETIYGV